MTAEVLSQLKVLRSGLADNVQGDPRYLTLSALDKSVAEIGAVASATPGDAGAVPTQVLGQLKTIRDGIADGLRNDHRYLTLSALDKSIAEIGGMLASAGLIDPEHATPMAPVHFEPGVPAAAPVAAAPAAPAAAASTPAAAAPASAAVAPAAEAPAPNKSKLKPVLETAAVVAAGMLAAEVIGAESKPASLAKSKPKPADASHEDEEAGDEAEEHDEAAEAKSEKADDAEKGDDEAAGDEADADEATEHGGEAAGDEADADEAKDHDGEADEADEKADDGDDAVSEKHDDDEAEHGEAHGETKEHGDEADDAKSGEIKASGGGGDEPKKADDGDAMPDSAGVIPKGKASGYVPMAAKAGAAQYQPGVSVKFGKLPNKVDLRSLMTPIEDQGDTSSCVANAVAGAYEYWVKKASKQDTNISRLFIYYNARWRGGSQDKDDGSVIQLAMEGLSKFGACPEHVWPFDPRLVLKKPGGEAYKDAAPFRVQDMAQVPLKLEAWKQALAEGKPIVFGIALFDSFDECSKRGGVVPMPSPDDVARAKHSGHSMCAVGYSDTEKVFIVRNSWGPDWGDKGYCYMPFDYLLNEKFNDGDNWVFVPKVPMQPPREVWSNTTEPVTNSGQGVDFAITEYTITDYAHIAVDLFEHVRKPFNGTILQDYGQYVSWASRSMWTEFASFDFTTFLATTAALTGVASLATEFSSETSETSETSESSEESSESSEENESEESEETDTDESEDDSSEDDESEDDDSDESDDEAEGDDEAQGDDDAERDDDAESEDDPDDAESDEDAEGDDDAAEGDEDSDDDESEGEDDTAGDGESEGDDESEGEDDADEESENEDDDTDEDDSEDDAGGEDEGGDDDGGDEGGGDEGGGDDDE